jgi:hypothetical protein
MEVIGKIIEILPKVTGSSSKGTWEKQDLIIETLEPFPKTICLANWGDKVDFSLLMKGIKIRAMVNLESREFNGKWYTDVKLWKIDMLEHAVAEKPQKPPPLVTNTDDILPLDDLPF